MKIREVIDQIIAAVPGAPVEDSVDVVKCGDPEQEVSGIVSTFMATCEVIEKAAALGANFIITHEPVFYSHLDRTEWLADDPVYAEKRALLEKHGIVVWRFHDYWHMHEPDGIYVGVVRALGWEDCAEEEVVYEIPPVSLGELAAHIKSRLGSSGIRMVGDAEMACRRVGLMVGAPGGEWQIRCMGKGGVDALVCGEINEWEISEYVRDARRQGRNAGLLVVGHAASEEAGMEYLVEWLEPRLPGVAITHVPAGDPFVHL